MRVYFVTDVDRPRVEIKSRGFCDEAIELIADERLGIQLPVIEKILNHTSGSFRGIVGLYQPYHFADEKPAALDAWARFVESLVDKSLQRRSI